MPIIAVFTKYDLLVEARLSYVERKRPDLVGPAQIAEAQTLALKTFERLCVNPLHEITGNCKIPYSEVSGAFRRRARGHIV